MDLWRTTTPRPILDVVTTERYRDINDNTFYNGRTGLAFYSEHKDYALTDTENHLSVALQALQVYFPQQSTYRLMDFKITNDDIGTFVFERLAST